MSPPARPLNIIHVFRAPLGGLFRHVVDLTKGQHARGHRVGIVCDTLTGGERADKALAELMPHLALGLFRTPMPRQGSWRDLTALREVSRRISELKADVVHGHGAKGGAYARFTLARRGPIRVYTPHGGSLNYDHATATGKFYLAIERLLMQRGDVYTFESAYSADVYRDKIGSPRGIVRVYQRAGEALHYVETLSAGSWGDFGAAVAMDGTTLAVGAPGASEVIRASKVARSSCRTSVAEQALILRHVSTVPTELLRARIRDRVPIA